MTWWRWLVAISGTPCIVVAVVYLRIAPRWLLALVGGMGVISGCVLLIDSLGYLGGVAALVAFAAGRFGRSPHGVFNFLVLQWFCVRLHSPVHLIDLRSPNPRRPLSPTEAMQLVEPWRLLRWIWPLTGWRSSYRYIRRP